MNPSRRRPNRREPEAGKVKEGKSKWDARQIRIKKIEEWTERATRMRFIIETKKEDLSAKGMKKAYERYFSSLKSEYSYCRFASQNLDDLREECEDLVKQMRVTNGGRFLRPEGLKERLDEFFDRLEEERHKKGLVMPMKAEIEHPSEAVR